MSSPVLIDSVLCHFLFDNYLYMKKKVASCVLACVCVLLVHVFTLVNVYVDLEVFTRIAGTS